MTWFCPRSAKDADGEERQCSYCDSESEATVEFDHIRRNVGSFVRMQACQGHYKQASQGDWTLCEPDKNALTLGTYNGGLTIEYGRAKRSELPDFLGGNPAEKERRPARVLAKAGRC